LSAVFSNDNKFIISGSGDETLKLWDVQTGECLKTFKGHSGCVFSVSFSNDNNFIISGSQDKTLKLWDVQA
jgi:WD40 repeat protein